MKICTFRGVVAVAAVWSLFLCSAAVADSRGNWYYDDALSRYSAGDARGALIQLKNALKHDPTRLSSRVLLGNVQLALGSPGEAESAFVMARQLGADPTLIAVPLAKARNRQNKFATNLAELVPTEYPRDIQPDLWVELGIARLGEKDPVGAEIAFAEALRLMPHHEGATVALARNLIEQKKFAEAFSPVTELLSRYPGNADAWFMMGSIYHARGELDSAVAHFQQAAQIDPGHAEALLGEALALLDGGKKEQAAAALIELRAGFPYFLKAHYFLVKALKELGRHEEARSVLRDASILVESAKPSVFENDPGKMLLAAAITYDSAEYEASFRFLNRYLKHEPDDLAANKRLARLLMKMGKPEDSSKLLAKLKNNHPTDIELLIMLGDARSMLNDHMVAERYYRIALETLAARPVDPAVLGRLGLSQLRQGDTAAAIGTFEWLAERDPEEVSRFSLFLGGLYLSDRRLDEARQLAERLVSAQPKNLAARNLLSAVMVAQGESDGARKLLEAIRAEDPDYRAALINLVKLDIIERKYVAAGEVIASLLEKDPNDLLALHESARLSVAQGDRATAIVQLERIRALNDGAIQPILELVNLYLAQGRVATALEIGEALHAKVPGDFEVTKRLAGIRLLQGDAALASSLLTQAARQAGYSVERLIEVARLQVRAGDHEAALVLLRKAANENPGSALARLELANLLARMARYAEAIVEANVALDIAPQNVAVLVLLGDISLAQDRPTHALEMYRRAQGLSDSPQLMVRTYRSLMDSGREDEALEEIRAWNKGRPDHPPVMAVLADHLRQIGETGASLQLFQRLAELTPRSAAVHNNLANLLMPVDAERALGAALKAHQLAPQDASVLDTLGWMRVQLGDLELGLSNLREAVTRNSRSPTLRYHLAVALQEFGNREEAIVQLRKALAMDEPFAGREDARQRLRQLESR